MQHVVHGAARVRRELLIASAGAACCRGAGRGHGDKLLSLHVKFKIERLDARLC